MVDSNLWETLYEKILEGDILQVIAYVFEYITKEDFFLNGSIKRMCIEFILLAVLAGIFLSFMDSFQTKEVSKMGYLMIHVLMFSSLFTIFLEMLKTTKEVINSILVVMNVAIPVYYMAVINSGNQITGYAYYRISVLVIYAVEQLVLHILLPFVSCYMILTFGNALWLEKKLSVITEYMKKAISFVLKALVGVISGVGFLQSMVSPVIDGIKNETVQKTISVIPGIGNAAQGMTELALGSLILIKNSVGVCIFCILIITAVVPVVKLFLTSILLKGCGALMSLIAEKNFSQPVLEVAEGVSLLLKIVLTVLLLFIVSMAIVLFTTS